MRDRRGYNLLEVIIAVAIGALLMTAAVQLMTATGRVFTRVQAHALAQTGGQLGVGVFTEDLRLASPQSLSIVSAVNPSVPIAIAFCPQDTSGTSVALGYSPASNYVLYYWDSVRSFWIRSLWTNTAANFAVLPGPGVQPLTGAQINAIIAATAPPVGVGAGPPAGAQASRILTQHVTAVTVTPGTFPGPTYTLPAVSLDLKIHFIYAQNGTQSGLQNLQSEFTEDFITQVTPRNGP